MAVEITASDIATLGGMSAARRRSWVDRGCLNGVPPFTEYDAIETAVAARIAAETNQQRATAAFAALRHDLKSAVLSSRGCLWVVVPVKGPEFGVHDSPQAAANAASRIVEPVWLVRLGGSVDDAKSRYKRHLELTTRAHGEVQVMRKKGLGNAGSPIED